MNMFKVYDIYESNDNLFESYIESMEYFSKHAYSSEYYTENVIKVAHVIGMIAGLPFKYLGSLIKFFVNIGKGIKTGFTSVAPNAPKVINAIKSLLIKLFTHWKTVLHTIGVGMGLYLGYSAYSLVRDIFSYNKSHSLSGILKYFKTSASKAIGAITQKFNHVKGQLSKAELHNFNNQLHRFRNIVIGSLTLAATIGLIIAIAHMISKTNKVANSTKNKSPKQVAKELKNINDNYERIVEKSKKESKKNIKILRRNLYGK